MLGFYADESGNVDPFDLSRPWFIVAAFGCDDAYYKMVDDALTDLKRITFSRLGINPLDVEIKSVLLRRAAFDTSTHNPFALLSPEDRVLFGERLYDVIDDLPIEWCAVAVDKRAYISERRGPAAFFSWVYTVLIERLHGWCRSLDTYGRIFMDERSASLLRGEHRTLVESHQQLLRDGSGWQPVDRIVDRPFFLSSRRSNHIQLADVIAYNIYRRFAAGDPAYPYFLRCLSKVRGKMRPDGGYYGLKVLP